MTKQEIVDVATLALDAGWQEGFQYFEVPLTLPDAEESDGEFTFDSVASIYALVNGERDGADWLAIFATTDGQFVVGRANQHSTGPHSWSSAGSARIATTIEDALTDLSAEERERLEIPNA